MKCRKILTSFAFVLFSVNAFAGDEESRSNDYWASVLGSLKLSESGNELRGWLLSRNLADPKGEAELDFQRGTAKLLEIDNGFSSRAPNSHFGVSLVSLDYRLRVGGMVVPSNKYEHSPEEFFIRRIAGQYADVYNSTVLSLEIASLERLKEMRFVLQKNGEVWFERDPKIQIRYKGPNTVPMLIPPAWSFRIISPENVKVEEVHPQE